MVFSYRLMTGRILSISWLDRSKRTNLVVALVSLSQRLPSAMLHELHRLRAEIA
jgi:hypothetical protein